MAQMNISIPDKLKAWVDSRVAEGSFAAAAIICAILSAAISGPQPRSKAFAPKYRRESIPGSVSKIRSHSLMRCALAPWP